MGSEWRAEDDQAALWNGFAGRAWVETQDVLDGMFRPFENLLVEEVAAAGGCQVLDVGSGTGSTTLAMARRLGAHGHVLGIDISEPMIAAARARAARENLPVDFIRADVQTHAFERARFDTIVSRFGVMFFDDPVRAFANLRRGAQERAGLRFAAWRSPAENPFMTEAERAAAPFLPALPRRKPDAPGQFAFADRDRIARILNASGWTEIDIQPVDALCTLPEPDLIRYLTRFGPVGRALQETDEATRGRIAETVRAAFDPYVHGAEVRFTAACWMARARA